MLTVAAGILNAGTNLAPNDAFFWNAGFVEGPGTLTLEPGVDAFIATDNGKQLAKKLVNQTTICLLYTSDAADE